jgi:dihydroorotate dehydrogenase electron transfer subunit
MTKRIENLKIVDNKTLTEDFCVLELESENKLPDFRPGQFVQVKVEGSPETFLRRPISVHDVDINMNRYKMLIQVLGKGTDSLYRLKSGDSLNVVHPLGNSFSDPENDGKILLIGGGTGIAPLLFLGKHLKINGFEVEYLLGFRNKSRAILIDEYSKVGKVHLTTEDGSLGEKGFVTAHSLLQSKNINMIYCCGPDPMMHAVAELCYRKNISCEVSLENLMACGFGICLCCIAETTRGNICTCTEGPVFNINELKWRTSE